MDGYQISDKSIDINKVRENIGMVFQHFNLFPHLSVRRNLLLAPRLARSASKASMEAHCEALLDKVGLGPRIDAMPSTLFRRGEAAGSHRPCAGQRSPGDSGGRTHR